MIELHVEPGDIARTIYTQITLSDNHESDGCSRQDRVIEAGARGNWCGSHGTDATLQSEAVDTQNDLLESRIDRATPSCIGTFSRRNRRIQTYGAV